MSSAKTMHSSQELSVVKLTQRYGFAKKFKNIYILFSSLDSSNGDFSYLSIVLDMLLYCICRDREIYLIVGQQKDYISTF